MKNQGGYDKKKNGLQLEKVKKEMIKDLKNNNTIHNEDLIYDDIKCYKSTNKAGN